MARETGPNIVFIMADQLKWSALKMYSEIGIETPSLERLAEEGVRFEHAVTPHPLCVPARVSVMTSRYAHSTGSRRNQTLMPPGEIHAFRIWSDLGYTTGLIGKNHCFEDESDLDLFDVYCEFTSRGLPARESGYGMSSNKGLEWRIPEETINLSASTRRDMPRQSPTISYAATDHPIEGYGTNVITAQAEAFLEGVASRKSFDGQIGSATAGTRPFALWVSYPDPHEPYEVPRSYADMFPLEDVVLPPSRDGEFDEGSAPERNRVLYEMMNHESDSIDDRRAQIATYQAMVRFVDDGVGRILDKLEELHLREDTIVVFTADHGDFIGEHGMSVKGGVFYDCLVRVPLIVSWPGGGVPQGRVDDSMVNTIDVVPTVLQLQKIADFTTPPSIPSGREVQRAGPKVPKEETSDVISSEALRRLQGSPLPTVTASSPRGAAFSEYGAGGPPFTKEMLEAISTPLGYYALIESLAIREAEGRRKMVRTKDWKYVTDSMAEPVGARLESGAHPEDELYDLRKDPWELNNVVRDVKHSAVIAEMDALLARWMIDTEDADPVPLPRSWGSRPEPKT